MRGLAGTGDFKAYVASLTQALSCGRSLLCITTPCCTAKLAVRLTCLSPHLTILREHPCVCWDCRIMTSEGLFVRRGEASACRCAMQGNGLKSPRACLQVGLVTYGTHVHVHELGFSECAKAFVFQVRPTYSEASKTCSAIPDGFAHFRCSCPTQHYGLLSGRPNAAVQNGLAGLGAGQGVLAASATAAEDGQSGVGQHAGPLSRM